MNVEALKHQECQTPDGKFVVVETIFTWVEGLPKRALVRYLEPTEGSGYGSYWADSLRPVNPIHD
jgi:hypothetical protein